MNSFYFFGFTILQPVFGLTVSVTRLQFAFWMFLRFFKEPARIVCVLFEGFSGWFVSSELEIIIFLSIIFKHFFRGAGFAYYLRTYSRFFSFVKPANKGY